METLKPCPFCGKPQGYTVDSHGWYNTTHECDFVDKVSFSSYEDMIHSWNSRTDRNAEIDGFCQELVEAWHQIPELRFGQFISDALSSCEKDIFYMTDDEMIGRLKRFSNLYCRLYGHRGE